MQQKRPGRSNDQKRPLDAVKGQGREVRPRLQNKTDGEKETVRSQGDHLRCMCYSNSIVDNCGKGTFLKLRETLRLLNLHYLSLVKEEKRCNNVEVSDIRIVNGSKFNISEKNESFNLGKEFDLLPVNCVKSHLKSVANCKYGSILAKEDLVLVLCAGIKVGHQFWSRSQMLLAGFREHWLGGTDDCMRKSNSKLEEFLGYSFPIAATMLLSGKYEDSVDDLLEVEYTGQGGSDLVFSNRQVKDQDTRLGNLALKHNMDHNVPVSVIRRQDCAHSYTGKVYTYDGLYKYHLKQLQQRSKLASKDQVSTIRGKVSKVVYALPGLVCKDISNGHEDICIPATNVIDNPPVAPSGFTYIKSVKVAENVIFPQSTADHGCNCKRICTNRRSCSCAKRNGSDFPYVRPRRGGGRLIEAKDVVFECGPSCKCGPGCTNRTSQQGLKYQLEVFRTKDKGWAVRSLDFIPSGAPVCEYSGVLRRTDELDNVYENDFIFEIDCWHTMNEIGVREKRMCNVSVSTSDLVGMTNNEEESEREPEYCIDAGVYGNVARFINHSCEPNLFVQCVLSSHHDVRLARVVLFAADDIPPMQAYRAITPIEDEKPITPSDLNSSGAIKRSQKYASDFCRGLVVVAGTESFKWRPSAEGVYKINTDAALALGKSVVGVGAITRNHLGLVMAFTA
ncbi:hypothetical protein LWI28_000211 [Acer negundo]|uniref:Uncharacterized protein n=1 Tax=Acer negundo TaxID=4023 RepID=A0AAD5NGF0_ACENE|nr:hypothetical protein LWI28_000211 [Acer negundo]